MKHPTGRFDIVDDDNGHLHNQPRHDDIGKGDLEDVPAFEFIEE